MKRFLIFLHRWLGVGLCLLFLIWFPSGIAMMYWGFPDVTEADRLARSPDIDPAAIRLSPAEALAALGPGGFAGSVRLDTFDGRPAYRFPGRIVYADNGEEQTEVSTLMVRRLAAAWTGQPVQDAIVERIEEVDQWTVQQDLRALRPLWKFSWPNGEQVYVSQALGEVVQDTTRASRLGAYLGPIPHWFYFTPLRKHGAEWSRVVIWSSGAGTVAAMLGLAVGAWMYSPSKRYRYDGAPTRIPYHGQKRWHMVLGLVFGLAAVTWAFSGMLSMDPFPRAVGSGGRDAAPDVPGILEGRTDIDDFAPAHPRNALTRLAGLRVKQLELASLAGEPFYLATLADGSTRIVPLDGPPRRAFEHERISSALTAAAPSITTRVIDEYDRYYLDRRRERPLPVIVADVHDRDGSRYYVDPQTGRVVGRYSDRDWMQRWLYNGLHSFNFPWLYNYRPLWDVVVIAFMAGGTALSVTSLVLAWRAIGKRLRGAMPGAASSRRDDGLALAD